MKKYRLNRRRQDIYSRAFSQDSPPIPVAFTQRINKYKGTKTTTDFISKTTCHMYDGRQPYGTYWVDLAVLNAINKHLFNYLRNNAVGSEGQKASETFGFLNNSCLDIGRVVAGSKPVLLYKKNDLELGCGEFGLRNEGENGTKFLRERGLKSLVFMKPMHDNICHKRQSIKNKVYIQAYLCFDHFVSLMLDMPSSSSNIYRTTELLGTVFPATVDSFSPGTFKVFKHIV
ncbi:hypothetical protein CU098_012717 [Rhizopus stolonifer]|uniref:Uncharacterized protein n=1 Tax=Rhizopus stolonifer TaxID=4846 RepID=A0A367KQB7_RHIST|nr:hypothetical protein CU098_012717 [Rhizopus stolonifer]